MRKLLFFFTCDTFHFSLLFLSCAIQNNNENTMILILRSFCTPHVTLVYYFFYSAVLCKDVLSGVLFDNTQLYYYTYYTMFCPILCYSKRTEYMTSRQGAKSWRGVQVVTFERRQEAFRGEKGVRSHE